MENIVLVSTIVSILMMVAVLVWLIQAVKGLKQQVTLLTSELARSNKDIAGLCSAAVSVDAKIIHSSEQLKQVVEKVTDFESQEQPSSQPYYSAIQRVREGADVEELMQHGLSREEAILLIRLHGERSP